MQGRCSNRYDLVAELEEAISHALDRGTNTKAVLRMPDVDFPEDEA